MTIRELSHSKINLINTINSSFEITSRLQLNFSNGKFSYDVISVQGRTKNYLYDEIDYSVYITDENKKIYFLFKEDELAGQIILLKYWSGYCYINDIRVAEKYRGKGFGKLLIEKAIEWAKEKNCIGLQVETQDINVNASKFYERLGFTLGGIDLFRYKSSEIEKNEIALDWYMLF